MRGNGGSRAAAALVVALAGEVLAVSNGQQAGAFLLIVPGARQAAMGEAFTGLADDVAAVTWNPAGLAQLEGAELALSYADWFADTSYSTLAVAGPVTRSHVVGAAVYYFHVPLIANVPEDVEKPVELSNFAAGPAYAWRISERWSVGAGLKFLSTGVVQANRPESSAAAAMFDLGAQYRRDDPPLSAGFVLQNAGARLKFRDSKSPTPFWARLGVGWRAYEDEWLTVKFAADMAQPIETGYKLKVPEGGIAQIFRLKLEHPKQNRYNYAIGTEWLMGGVLALRAGWTFRVGSDVDSPSAGAGVRFALDPFTYALDYSYSYWSDLSANVSRVSLTIGLRPRPHEPEE